MSLLAGFFDCSIVFAVGFMLAWMGRAKSAETSAPPEERESVDVHESKDVESGPGRRLGVAYRLPNGSVVYVPDRR